MKQRKKLYVLMLIFCLSVSIMDGCSKGNPQKTSPKPMPTASEKSATKTSVAPSYAILRAVGDDIIYNTIYWQAQKRTGKAGQYNFAPVYEHVAADIANADIAMVNQETPLASKVAAVSSYPQFNSPTAVGDELVSMGFDVINHANNHVLDQGEKGLLATLSYWSEKPNIVVTGIRADKTKAEDIPVVMKNGIKFAFLGYTQMTNGLSLPKDSSASIYYTSDEMTMKKQITEAKAKADVVVISVHWGVEYTNKPNESQKKLAKKMSDWGADIIIGTHPHVIQPVETITAKDGHQTLVYYSLGNFLAHQNTIDTMLGGMADIKVKKDGDSGKVTIETAKFVPLVIQCDKPNGQNIRIYKFSQYTKSLAQSHFLASKGFTYDVAKKHFLDVIGTSYLEWK